MSLSSSQRKIFALATAGNQRLATEKLLKAVKKVDGATVSQQKGSSIWYDCTYKDKKGCTYSFVLAGKLKSNNGCSNAHGAPPVGSNAKKAIFAIVRDYG